MLFHNGHELILVSELIQQKRIQVLSTIKEESESLKSLQNLLENQQAEVSLELAKIQSHAQVRNFNNPKL